MHFVQEQRRRGGKGGRDPSSGGKAMCRAIPRNVSLPRRRSRSRPKSSTTDEELSGSLCDICNSTCQFFDIVCDKCDVDWHAHCVGVTREQAERIDKWYCERCLAKDARLRTTFKEGQDAEVVANAAATPPPGPSRDPKTSAQASQRKKRPITATEAITRPAKRTVNATPDGPVAKTEAPTEVAGVAAEHLPTMEAQAKAEPMVEEQRMATVQPTTKTLAEQLKEAHARNKTLEEEKAALQRAKTAAESAKEELQKVLDEAKAEASAERVKRIAVEQEMAKNDRVIAVLNARLLELNQL